MSPSAWIAHFSDAAAASFQLSVNCLETHDYSQGSEEFQGSAFQGFALDGRPICCSPHCCGCPILVVVHVHHLHLCAPFEG